MMLCRKEKMVLCLTTLYGNDRINRICHRCGRFLLYNCGCDGIGRHARFRFLCREACRFKSCHPHQTPERRFRGFCVWRPWILGFKVSAAAPVGAGQTSTGRLAPCHPHQSPRTNVLGFCVQYYRLESIKDRRFWGIWRTSIACSAEKLRDFIILRTLSKNSWFLISSILLSTCSSITSFINSCNAWHIIDSLLTSWYKS